LVTRGQWLPEVPGFKLQSSDPQPNAMAPSLLFGSDKTITLFSPNSVFQLTSSQTSKIQNSYFSQNWGQGWVNPLRLGEESLANTFIKFY